jgi:hypothetical protein
MEPMDGCALARRAKELRPSLRVAMVSALHRAEACDGCPIEAFQAKPVSVEALIRSLKAAERGREVS